MHQTYTATMEAESPRRERAPVASVNVVREKLRAATFGVNFDWLAFFRVRTVPVRWPVAPRGSLVPCVHIPSLPAPLSPSPPPLFL